MCKLICDFIIINVCQGSAKSVPLALLIWPRSGLSVLTLNPARELLPNALRDEDCFHDKQGLDRH